MDHLRPSDARAQMYLDAPHDVRFVAQQRHTFFSLQEKEYVMSFVLEIEKTEMKVCSYQ